MCQLRSWDFPVFLSLKPFNWSKDQHLLWIVPLISHGDFPQLCYDITRLGKSHKIPWNHHFPMVFLWFSDISWVNLQFLHPSLAVRVLEAQENEGRPMSFQGLRHGLASTWRCCGATGAERNGDIRLMYGWYTGYMVSIYTFIFNSFHIWTLYWKEFSS